VPVNKTASTSTSYLICTVAADESMNQLGEW
jgi:hypothetical protein